MVPPQILTATGRYFDFTRPTRDMIDIEDIAIALSRMPRFTGHTTQFYSVAQHSVLVSHNVPEEYALQGLLHDATEAYMGDMSTPLKQLIPAYKEIEHRVEQAICERFGLPFPLHPSIKAADLRMLVTERRDLMPKPLVPRTDREAWTAFSGIPPFQWGVWPQPSRMARNAFIDRFKQLTS
ncbi:metal-dependent phosphohydrolase [Burkholderia cenocepacia]|nr:metal-dependent phosphohydrolase [Burkholderia cenocepacia]